MEAMTEGRRRILRLSRGARSPAVAMEIPWWKQVRLEKAMGTSTKSLQDGYKKKTKYNRDRCKGSNSACIAKDGSEAIMQKIELLVANGNHSKKLGLYSTVIENVLERGVAILPLTRCWETVKEVELAWLKGR